MIYIRTFAYNAQETIVKTIESVLSQTIEDFQFYLMDNGSADKTGEIIRQYAEKDSRIIPFYNKKNLDYDECPDFWNLTCSLKDEDYYVALDADDYYESTFLEEIMAFMERESLDVAACGTEFFDAETGVARSQRVLKTSLVLRDRETWESFFPYIHWNLRQVWGKVYSGKVAKQILGVQKPEWWPMAYGGDTANVLTCLKYANSFGVYGKVLHHYRMSKKSVSHKWAEGREVCDLTLHQKTCAFLLDKVGHLSENNLKFLSVVYLYAVKDTLDVLSRAEIPISKKWQLMDTIFTEQTTLLSMKMDLSSIGGGISSQTNIREYKKQYLKWTLTMTKHIKEDDIPILKNFLTSFNPLFNSFLTNEQLYNLMIEAPEVVWNLANNDLVKALTEVESLLENRNKHEGYELLLAQNLAALNSDEEKYVQYSKEYINYLISCGERELALAELDEWLEVVPDDDDFRSMRDRIS